MQSPQVILPKGRTFPRHSSPYTQFLEEQSAITPGPMLYSPDYTNLSTASTEQQGKSGARKTSEVFFWNHERSRAEPWKGKQAYGLLWSLYRLAPEVRPAIKRLKGWWWIWRCPATRKKETVRIFTWGQVQWLWSLILDRNFNSFLRCYEVSFEKFLFCPYNIILQNV